MHEWRQRQSDTWRKCGRYGVAGLQFLTYYLAAVVGIIYMEQYFVQVTLEAQSLSELCINM